LNAAAVTRKRPPRLADSDGSDQAPEAVQTAAVLPISHKLIGELADLFKLLADPSRLKIVLALAREGKMHVSALKDMLDQTQPAVSHHLTLMRMVGLVGFDRKGKHNFYYLASDHLRDLLEQFFSAMGNDKQAFELEEFSLAYTRREPC